ncbi:MAG: TVP38/TMEM64 family protein [Clostridia bacterium]|nr:TVP38/TMEM64 family protein [Clostridia bacterium]
MNLPLFKPQYIRRILLILFWLTLVVICWHHRSDLTVEGILNFTPENPFLAVLIMLGLFLLKSVTFVIYGNILYAASGILFPLPAAVFLNVAGSAIMATIPFLMGRRAGRGLLETLTEKYPKLTILREVPQKNEILSSVIIRLLGILPGDLVSMYFGTSGVRYSRYLAGTLIGLFPSIVIFSVMGMSVSDITSPTFWISVAAEIVLVLISFVILLVLRKKSRSSGKV